MGESGVEERDDPAGKLRWIVEEDSPLTQLEGHFSREFHVWMEIHGLKGIAREAEFETIGEKEASRKKEEKFKAGRF